MLSSTQKKFRKEMEQLAKESVGQTEVYSYVEDRHMAGNYSGYTVQRKTKGRIVKSIAWSLIICLLLLGIYKFVQQKSNPSYFGVNETLPVSKDGQNILTIFQLNVEAVQDVNDIISSYNSMIQTGATLEIQRNFQSKQTDLVKVFTLLSSKINSGEYPKFAKVYLETLAQTTQKGQDIAGWSTRIAISQLKKLDSTEYTSLFQADMNEYKQLTDKLSSIFKTICDAKGYSYTVRPDGSMETVSFK